MNYVLKYAPKTAKTMGLESVSASKSTTKMTLASAFRDKNARKTVQGMHQVIVCVTLASSKMSSQTDKSTVSGVHRAPIGMHKDSSVKSSVHRMPSSTPPPANVSASKAMQSSNKFAKFAPPTFSSPTTTVFSALSSPKSSTMPVSALKDILSMIWVCVLPSAPKSINSLTLSPNSAHAIKALDMKAMPVLSARTESTPHPDNANRDVEPMKCYQVESVCV